MNFLEMKKDENFSHKFINNDLNVTKIFKFKWGFKIKFDQKF